MKWQEQFPNFPATDMPDMGADWIDHSWCNDAAPSFYSPRFRVWAFVYPRDRAAWPYDLDDCENEKRIVAYYGDDENGADFESPAIAESEEWQEILTILENPETERAHICDKWTVCLGISFHPDSRSSNYPELTGEEKERFDRDMNRLFEISQDPYSDGLAAFERAKLI